MFLRLYISILVTYLSIDLHSQEISNILHNKQFKFEELTYKDGLKHHSITEVSQDSRGYMWFGTFNGIYKINSDIKKEDHNKIINWATSEAKNGLQIKYGTQTFLSP